MDKSILKKFLNNIREDLPIQFVNVIVFLLDFFYHPPAKKQNKKKSILFVRTDLLGDYIVWNNALKKITEKYKLQGYNIVLLGNESWVSLAKITGSYDELISINRKKYFKDFSYRKNVLNKLNEFDFDFLFQTAYSRDFAISDSIVRNVNAKTKIAFRRNKEAEWSIWNFISNRWYTDLIEADKKETFEFYRIVRFLNTIGINENKYSTVFSDAFERKQTGEDYFVVLPGASSARRCLEPEKFTSLINKVSELTNLKSIICGAPNEIEIGNKIMPGIKYTAENMIGETSLNELGNILSNAKFVLGNETGTLHYAAALNVPTVCLLGGGHFRKVMPYDEKITTNKYLPLAVYKEMECFNCNWRCKYVTEKNKIVPCISNLSTDYILEKISGFICEVN